jgi:hypothetical protein
VQSLQNNFPFSHAAIFQPAPISNALWQKAALHPPASLHSPHNEAKPNGVFYFQIDFIITQSD